MTTQQQRFDPDDLAMNALIIYNNFLSAKKISTALEHSARNTDFAVRWNIMPWRVDLLKFTSVAEEALTEALGAHLIVFAGLNAQWLPFWLQGWLEHWVKCRRIENAALAVFGGEQASQLSPFATLDVQNFAKRHGLSIIFNDSGVEAEVRAGYGGGIHTPPSGWRKPAIAV
jgi:hypothetical protein